MPSPSDVSENAAGLCQRLGFRNPIVTNITDVGVEVNVRTFMHIVLQRLGPQLNAQGWKWDGVTRSCTMLVRTSKGIRRVQVTNATNPLVSQLPSVFIFFDNRPLNNNRRPRTQPYPYVRINPLG